MSGLVVMIVFALLGVLLVVLLSNCSPEARLRRRRRKSHSPVASSAPRPTVRLNARTPRRTP